MLYSLRRQPAKDIFMNLNIKNFWSLKTKLTILTSTIFLVSIWSLAFYASRVLQQDMHQLLSEQQFTTASIVASQVNQELDDRFTGLKKVAGGVSPAILGNSTKSQNLLESKPVLQEMFNGGTFITQIDGTATASIPYSIGRIGVNFMNRDHISAALKEGKSTVGRPVVGAMIKSPSFVMTVPIYDAQDNVIGALAGVVDLGKANFLDKLTDNQYGKTGGYLLVAPQYRLVVTATDKSRIMQQLPDAGINPLIDQNIAGYEGSMILVNPLGLEVLASMVKIPAAGWYIAVTLPTAEAFAPIYKIQKPLLLATVMMTVLAGSLTWWMLRRLLAPMLDTVTALVTMVASSKQPQPLPIFRQDEIGQLIGSFNDLLNSLAQQGKALRESESRYRSILNASPVPVGIYDEQQNITYVNPEFVKTFGYTLEDIPTLMDWWSQAYPNPAYQQEITGTWQVHLETAKQTGESFTPFEVTIRCKDLTNKTVVVAAASSPGTLKNDLVVIFHDITERKRMEQQLNESLRKSRSAYSLMRMLCDNVPDMIWAKDLEGRYTFANEAMCRDLLNATGTDEPIGKMDMFFAERERTRHPDNPEWHTFGEICQDTDVLTLDAGTPQQFDEHGNVQGKFLFLDVHKAPFLDDKGRMIGTVGSARNVTTIKDMERKLKKSEVSLRTLVQTIPDLVWLKDPTGVYLDCNVKFECFFGGAKKDVVGKTDYDFVSKKLADHFRENDRKALAAGVPCSNEEWLIFADTGYRGLFDTIKTPMYDAEGSLIGVLGIAHDVTERKQAEEALQVLLAEKEVLMREVHHRVKNNMAAIIGLLDLQRQAMGDPQTQTVMTDLSSRIRAMSLVHEKLYRSESLSKIDFQEYLQSLISHLRTSFGSPHIRCEIEAQGIEMPLDLAVPCGMIVNELIINALKYAFPTERNGEGNCILVTLHHDHDTFTLSVADNGVGLPPEFDLNTTTSLGLSLVQMLGQHQLGGRYEIDGIGGTRFTLTFSLQDGGKPYA